MTVPYRQLAHGQRCRVWTCDIRTGEKHLIHETGDMLLEAPNWVPDGRALILNGKGLLWRLELDSGILAPIPLEGVPPLNNDHVIDPDGKHIFLSAYEDWQIYRAPLAGGRARLISGSASPQGLMHFLHGVSPSGHDLAFVGLRTDRSAGGFKVLSAEICLLDADGQNFRQLTFDGVPADGPEFAPDGTWIYLNTEVFSGHAQIARMRPDGSEMTRLTNSQTVDWFPHLSPDGKAAVYLAYPPGTQGHPADLWVDLMLVEADNWENARSVARILGGQGTINVNSWSPDSTSFAYVDYPAG